MQRIAGRNCTSWLKRLDKSSKMKCNKQQLAQLQSQVDEVSKHYEQLEKQEKSSQSNVKKQTTNWLFIRTLRGIEHELAQLDMQLFHQRTHR